MLFPKTGVYIVNTGVNNHDKLRKYETWNIEKEEESDKPYAYEDAINLTGHGPYSILLLVACCLAMIGLVVDMYAIAAISSVAACELNLGGKEENILMSTPFLGAIVTVFFWGYLSDMYGRRKIMLITMWASFGIACLSAMSPHWIMLAVFKFLSVSCSSCAQSISYTLIGESCATKVKAVYYFILTSVIYVCTPLQTTFHYYTLTLDFSINLGFINFVPWRFLTLIMALPLGISAICLHFVYESPKFLANAGKETEAVEILAKIWKRNRQPGNIYPVKKLIFNEESSSRSSGLSLLKSLWNQTVPLFRRPLLFSTLQLFYLIIAIYIANNGLFSWFPYLADAYITGSVANHTAPGHANEPGGLCNIISHYAVMKQNAHSNVSCIPKSNVTVVLLTIGSGIVFVIINCLSAILAHRRKVLMIVLQLICSVAALACAVLTNNFMTLLAFSMIFFSVVCIGIIYSYYVDLYPTSYRAMASCQGSMVSRISTIVAINLIGSFFVDHCNATFYFISAVLLSGAIASYFLPPDQTSKSN